MDALATSIAAALRREPAERPDITAFVTGLEAVGAAATGLWAVSAAVAPALQNEVDEILAGELTGVAAKPPAPPAQGAPVVRPIPVTEPPPAGRRGRDHVVRRLSTDPNRERRRRALIWTAAAAAAIGLGALAISGPRSSDESTDVLRTVPASIETTAVDVRSRAGVLPEPGADTLSTPPTPTTAVDARRAGLIFPTSTAAPTTVPPTTEVVRPTVVLPTVPPTTRPAPTTRATNPATAPPPPATTAAPATTVPPAPATTLPATTTTSTTTTTTAPATTTTTTTTTATTTTTGGARPFINGISISPNGDGTVSLTADAERCAAYSWSIQSDDGAVSMSTGLRYPNGNCFSSPPSYTSGPLPPGGYTVVLRLKSTTNGRENSASRGFTI